MAQITKIIKPYSEVVFEIQLNGQFNPDTFSPLWFEKNNILGSIESEEIYEKKFNPGDERAFSTPFIDIRAQQNSFQIGIIDLKSIDILLDFTTGLVGKISPSLSNNFFVNLRLHFINQENKKQLEILNRTTHFEQWNIALDNPRTIMTRLEETIIGSNHEIIKTTSISKCPRKDLRFPIHLNTYNKVTFDMNKSNILSILTSEFVIDLLNNSISSTNKIINSFF